MVPIRKKLVSTSKYSIKCPYSMKPIGITVHNTANNASAENEISYMINNDKQVSFHFAVDDKEIVQGLPEDKNGWHAGDGNGDGNRKTLSIEICYSTGDKAKFEKAQENAAEFVALKLKQYGWDTSKVYPHKHWSSKHCPHRTLDEYGWDYFINLIKKYLNPPAPAVKEMYRIRKTWADAASQIGAYNDLNNAKAACKEGYTVFDSKGNAIYTKTAPKSVLKSVNEIAKEVIAGKWGNGEARKQALTKAGYNYTAVQAAVSKLLNKTTGYKVQVTASALNVRSGAGVGYKVNKVVKKGQILIIVSEKSGWGKLSDGSGWVSLNYTKKV